MGEIHDLVLRVGVEKARELFETPEQRRLVDLAARILAEESGALGITYAGFCMTSLPHKRPTDDAEPWVRHNGRFSLMIEPGYIMRGGTPKRFGVPFGARARMILLYLCTQAIRNKTKVIEIGRSMADWMNRLGITRGGESYAAVREQANRIGACRMTISWRGEDGGNADSQNRLGPSKAEGFTRENIINGMLSLRTDGAEGAFWEDTVELTESFYSALQAHPVPLWEPALQAISSQPLVLDLYVWLAYRLFTVKKPTPVSWEALQSQFGPEYKRARDFRKRFTEALAEAVAVYPEANVRVIDTGIELRPSRPAVGSQIHQVALPGC